MKTLYLTSFLIFSAAWAQEGHADNPFADDKIAHFSVSVISTASLTRLGQVINSQKKITVTNRVVSSLLVAAAGLAKEMSDKKRDNANSLDQGDLRANAAGIVFGNIILIDF